MAHEIIGGHGGYNIAHYQRRIAEIRGSVLKDHGKNLGIARKQLNQILPEMSETYRSIPISMIKEALTPKIMDKEKPEYHEELLELFPEMATVSGGVFMMSKGDYSESPLRQVNLPDFVAGKFPVTVGQYLLFLIDTEPLNVALNLNFVRIKDSPESMKLPANVSWKEAVRYCEWLSGNMGNKFGPLPEIMWEYAARGPQSRLYPWGDFPDKNRYNKHYPPLTPVDKYPRGRSWCGLWDMYGNGFEWVLLAEKNKNVIALRGCPPMDLSYRLFSDGKRGEFNVTTKFRIGMAVNDPIPDQITAGTKELA